MSWIRWLLYLPPGGSTFADGIDLLHFFVIGVTMLAATGIAALTLYYMIRYRRRSPSQVTEQLVGSALGEVSIIGSVLALFLVFWVVGFRQYVQLETPPDDALVVQVTAKQWMWKFSYPDGHRAINVLTVPVGRPVKLFMTSRDVIHSFFVPGFRIKQDVIPGRYVTAWFQATSPGHYDLYCAEYCGISHSRMLGTVNVLSQSEYAVWLGQDDAGDALADREFQLAGGTGTQRDSDLVELGRIIAARRQCFACHTSDGQLHIGPSWRGLFGSTIALSDGSSIVANEAYLTRSMMDPASEVHAGFKPLMPTYQGLLQAPEVAAIVEYIKSLRADVVETGVQLPTIPGTRVSAEQRLDVGDAGD